MKDSELNPLLEAATTPAPPPSGFQRAVWSRIEETEAAAWKPDLSNALERFFGFFTTPSVALSTCTAMVLAGAWLSLQARDSNPPGELAYVRSISPFAHAQPEHP